MVGLFLNKKSLLGEDMGQGKTDYDVGGMFYAMFIASKVKNCLTINAQLIIKDEKTFKCFEDVYSLLASK